MTDELERAIVIDAKALRELALEEISPACVRVLTRLDDQEILCGHKLRRHDPCSDCICPGFLDPDGRGAEEAAAALITAHPDLFTASP